MDHFVNIPVDHTGLIPDPRMAQIVGEAMTAPFAFTDVFLYSHGWWTSPTDAMTDYSRFSVEFMRTISIIEPQVIPLAPKSSFAIGVYWPSTLSADPHEFINLFEPLTFYQMEKRSDDVGQNAVFALLQLMYQTREQSGLGSNFRLTLIGHSFGCRVLCRALQRLVHEICKPTTRGSYREFIAKMPINLVLIQPAFESTDLQKGDDYGDVRALPNLRILSTRSDLDLALKNLYPLAEHINILSLRPGTRQALGYAGPTAISIKDWNAKFMTLMPGFVPSIDQLMSPPTRMLVADLTAIHRESSFPASALKGHHSDIFLPELYRLIAKFAFE